MCGQLNFISDGTKINLTLLFILFNFYLFNISLHSRYLFIFPEGHFLSQYILYIVFFGKFCIAGSFAVIYNYSAELFPTVLRNTGLGVGSMCARLSAALTPLIGLMVSKSFLLQILKVSRKSFYWILKSRTLSFNISQILLPHCHLGFPQMRIFLQQNIIISFIFFFLFYCKGRWHAPLLGK